MEASDKAAWRARVRESLRALSAEARADGSRRLHQMLSVQPVWQRAQHVLFFSPLADEPDITPSLDDALQADKAVALPRFDALSARYVAAGIRARAELMAGRFGALEPGPDCPVVPLNQLDLILVPGVAFDFAGRRLGRGKGFYDRLLAEVRGHKCGVAFDEQIVPQVPEEPHDVRVDSIVTPSRWHSCPRSA